MAAFREALQSDEGTVLQLAPRSTYVIDQRLHVAPSTDSVNSNIVIDGRGARLIVRSVDQDLVTVAEGDFLKVRDLTISIEFSGGQTPRVVVPISIRGDSVWRNVSIVDSDLRAWNNIGLFSFGASTLTMENVTIAGNTFQSQHIKNILDGSGNDVRLQNVTIARNTVLGSAATVPVLGFGIPGTYAVTVQNSVIEDCGDHLVSEGGNVFLDGDCGPSAGDVLVDDARFDQLGDHGGLVPALALFPDSPALGRGVPGGCPATDARGYLRGADCDAGAFEFGAGAAGGRLDMGGLNGTWLGSDGSVVLVNRNNQSEVLLVWLTLDASGKQRWVHGVMPLQGLEAGGPAYVSEASAAGPPGARRIGSMQIEFTSCGEAGFTFTAHQSDLSTRSLDLSRLSLVAQLGCTEP